MRAAFGRLAILAALLPATADAHLSGAKIGDFWLGLLHPLTTLEDVAAFIALGLLAGHAGDSRGLKMVGTFAIAIGVGGVLGIHGVQGQWVEWLNLGSLVVFGGLVALALAIPLPILLGMAAVFGITHGISNGVEALPPIRPWLFTPGLIAAGFLLPFYSMWLANELKPWWARIALRVVGSWIAATGLLVLALSAAKTSGRL